MGDQKIEANGFIYGNNNFRTFLDDDELSDVYPQAAALYLAGKGRIWTYDLGERSVGSTTWDLEDASNIKIVGLDDDEPVSWSRGTGRAFRGGALMEPEEDRVLNMSMGPKHIWTVRRGEAGRRYLRADEVGGFERSRVFFKHPKPVGDAVGASRIMDARSLGNGTIGVLTDEGVALYYPNARSWVGVDGLDSSAKPQRLYQLGDKKLVFEQKPQFGEGIDIKLINLPLREPDPVELSPIEFNYDELEGAGGEDIVATAYDEDNGLMAYVTESGRVVEYNSRDLNLSEFVLLPEANQIGPKSSEDFWRAYDEPGNDNYLFAAKDTIWRYDAQRHLWNRFILNFQEFPEPEVANVNIEFDFGDPVVNVRDRDGAHYIGSLITENDRLKQIFSPQKNFSLKNPRTSSMSNRMKRAKKRIFGALF